ncbi:MAG: hypothetical protein JWM18_2800 [Chloroflexi bacterium]|jgi:hypothetical protein|nr:hypothetical protein [Chloroflexota bacterium]
MLASLNATTLGYFSGVLGAIVAVALLASLGIVYAVLVKVGRSLATISETLGDVAANTDPVPPTLAAVNEGLTTVGTELRAVENHLATGKAVFAGYANGSMG